jgi:hypothetical protein
MASGEERSLAQRLPNLGTGVLGVGIAGIDAQDLLHGGEGLRQLSEQGEGPAVEVVRPGLI